MLGGGAGPGLPAPEAHTASGAEPTGAVDRLPKRKEAFMSGRAATQALRRWIRSDRGQDLVEYGLLMALIAVAAIAGVHTIGTTINTVFWEVIASHY
jgi:Flp pilus assembly pilin Flp